MYMEERICKEMVKFIIGVELPLSVVDNDHFTTLVKEHLQLRYVWTSRNTLCNDTLEYFVRNKNQLLSDLHKYDGINEKCYIAVSQ